MNGAFSTRNKFAYTMLDGQLTRVELLKVISREESSGAVATIVARNGDEIVQVKDAYESEEDFKNGSRNEFLVSRKIANIFDVQPCSDYVVSFWIFQDGEPVEVSVEVSEVTYDIESDTFSSPQIPDVCYDSRRRALAYNTYVVREGDEEHEHVGGALRAMLTPEQESAVTELEHAFSKLDKLNVRCEHIGDKMVFLNGDAASDWCIEYYAKDAASTIGCEVDEICVLDWSKLRMIDTGYGYGDDNNIYVKI